MGTVFLLFVAALYPTVWLHEIAHSIVAYSFGCKENWWSTDITPYLYRSFGGDIDYACLTNAHVFATAAVDTAGVVANLAAMGSALLISTASRGMWLKAWLLSFAAMNHIEAFSYLTVNVFLPRSDMIALIKILPFHPWLLGVASTILCVIIIKPIFARLSAHMATRVNQRSVEAAILIGSGVIVTLMLTGRSDLTETAGPRGGDSTASADSPRGVVVFCGLGVIYATRLPGHAYPEDTIGILQT